ncbi:MAG TPA: hypothetical protein VMW51_05965 [Terriglobia bacterium]|nr:hypothetical protein [Terriglobia bacterium]
MMTLPLLSGFPLPALWAINLGVIVPLALSCLVLIAVIPSAAWRGKLNVPVYALIMFAAAFVAFGVGRLAGAPSVRATTLGVIVSFIFFLLVATAVGSFFGMFFYRQPLDESLNGSNQQTASNIPALDDDRH